MTVTRARVRGLAAAAVLTVSLGSLTACGDDSSSATGGSSTSSSSSSSSSSSASSSASSEASSSATGSSDASGLPPAPGSDVSPEQISALLKSSLDKATSAKVTMQASGQAALNMNGLIDFNGTNPTMSMTMSISGQKIQARLVDGTMYLETSPGKWVSYDSSDPSNPMGSFADQLDLGSMFDAFAKGVDKATYVGKDGGLDHYNLTLNTATMLKAMGQKMPAGAAGQVPKTLEYDMYFDSEGRPAKVVFDIMGEKLTATYSDWGTDVKVSPPPANQVTKAG